MGSTDQIAWVGDVVRFTEDGTERTGTVTAVADYAGFSYYVSGCGPMTEITPTGEVDWKARYDALVEAVLTEATEQEWCAEFEQVMNEAGFEDIAAARTKTYTVNVKLTYELNAYQLDSILHEHFGGRHDVRDEVGVESLVSVKVTTKITDPSDLEDSDDLADALKSAGYSDWESVEVTDMNEN